MKRAEAQPPPRPVGEGLEETADGWDPSGDIGLTRERTLLSWHRTGLAFVVSSALLVKSSLDGGWQGLGPGLAVTALVVGAFVHGSGDHRFMRRFWRKRRGSEQDVAFRLLSACTAALASAATCSIVLA